MVSGAALFPSVSVRWVSKSIVTDSLFVLQCFCSLGSSFPSQLKRGFDLRGCGVN